MEHSKKTQDKNVKKVVQEYLAKENLTKEEVIKFMHFRRLASSSKASKATPKELPSFSLPKKPIEAKRKTIIFEFEEEEEIEKYQIHVRNPKTKKFKKPFFTKFLFESLSQGEDPKEVGKLCVEANDEDKSYIVKLFYYIVSNN